MEKSGIREFCTTVCKGGCCNYDQELPMEQKACCSRISCHEKLPCVGYICGKLRNYLRSNAQLGFRSIPNNWVTADVVSNIMDHSGDQQLVHKNPFFAPYSLEEVSCGEFPDELYDIPPKMVTEIRQVIDGLLATPQSEECEKIVGCCLH